MMNFSVPVNNRFQILEGRESEIDQMDQYENKTPDLGISRQDFVDSTIDRKLIYMFDELREIRNDQVNFVHGFQFVGKSLAYVSEKLENVVGVTNTQSEFIKTLAYKSIDMEARSRRNNLIFRGFAENRGENCFEMVREFLANRFDIDPRGIYMARAHRLGRIDHSKQFQRRPVIVNFRDFGDIEMIMSRVAMLKGSKFSVDYDYPKEIQEARSKLWPLYKEL